MLVFVSGLGDARAQVRLRDARTGRIVYEGRLAGLADLSAGGIGGAESRRFELLPTGPAGSRCAGPRQALSGVGG